jgi:hypothetical protein
MLDFFIHGLFVKNGADVDTLISQWASANSRDIRPGFVVNGNRLV